MRHATLLLVLFALLLSPVAALGQQEEEPPSREGFREAGQPTNDFPRGESPRDSPGDVSAARASSSLSFRGGSVTAFEPHLVYRNRSGDIVGAIRLSYNLRDTNTNTTVLWGACEDIKDRSDPCWNGSYVDGGYYDREDLESADSDDCPTRDGQIHATYTRVIVDSPSEQRRTYVESPDNDRGEFYTGYRCREND